MPSIRLASVNYPQQKLSSWEEFVESVSYWTGLAADANADFICFPEFLTLQLLSLDQAQLRGRKAIERLQDYTDRFHDLMSRLARGLNINIIGGSHLTLQSPDRCHNIASFYARNGERSDRGKVHVTPSEKRVWHVSGVDSAEIITTDVAKIGIMICYDSEFPEMARHLVAQGADILFVPFCTDDRQGYLRVRYSCQARAVENQCYMVLSGNVGHLQGVHNMDAQYGQSSILTPCDYGFPRDGIAAESAANLPEISIADVRLEDLARIRRAGSVRNLEDRRLDLYTTWNR